MAITLEYSQFDSDNILLESSTETLESMELSGFGFAVKSIVSESEVLISDNTENGDEKQNLYIAKHVLEALPHELLDLEIDKEINKALLNQLCDISNLLSDFEPDKEGSTAYILTQYVDHLAKVSNFVNNSYDILKEQINGTIY